MKELRVLILAAGKGTRLKSKKAKVLHRAGGATLLEHVVRAARSVSSDIWAVVGHQAETVKSIVPDLKYVQQKGQLGTGQAAMSARDSFPDYTGDLLVLPGDAPLLNPEILKAFVSFHQEAGFEASVLTAEVENPHGYGRIVRRDELEVDRIVEDRDAVPQLLQIREVNSGVYVFHAPEFYEALPRLNNDNAQGEYYLTDVIAILVEAGHRVGAYKTANPEAILGINTRKELAHMERLMRFRKCESLMAEGVSIVDPETTFIDAEVVVGTDTVIYPSVQIEGRSVIGEEVTIHSYSRITNSHIGSRSTVLESCVLVDTTVGEDGTIGPFAHLRMGTVLENEVRVGNFVEVKKSTLGKGTKSMHLTYLGDATIGKNVNIGAGTITCNYDGVSKNPTVIEDEAFIGSDSQLIAPVRIGRGAYVAAGSSITEDVPAESLAIARGRQNVKEGWAKERKKAKAKKTGKK